MVETTIFFLMVLPGIVLALRGSSFLVDYTIFVFVFNREIRRLVDYYNGQFNPLSLISLTPLVMLALLFVSFIGNFKALHPTARQIFLLLLAAIGYGFIIGLSRNGAACIYQGAQYYSTIGLMGYAAIVPATNKQADRWLITAAVAGVLAAAYGWYQYYVIPDWDAFWVKAVGFVGYLGKLESTKMWVYSTFSDRGVCAVYLALAAIPVFVSSRWRLFMGWPEAALMVSCIFPTMSRGGIIVAALGILLYPILNGGKHAARVIIIAALVVGVFFAVSGSIPGLSGIVKRFESLTHMQDDGSFQGRVVIAQATLPYVLSHPIGFGIGSSGLAERLNGPSTIGVVTDSGWVELISSLGVPGFLLFVAALMLIWRYFSMLGHLGVQDDYLGLAKTFFVVALIATWTGNLFIDFSVMWIAIGRALSPSILQSVAIDFDEPTESEPATAVFGIDRR
jgi:putative inorganic carbon (hco3(-)) transporter